MWWTAELMGKSSASNVIKRERCMDLLQLLPFSSLYQNGDIERINDTNDFAEALEQQVDAV